MTSKFKALSLAVFFFLGSIPLVAFAAGWQQPPQQFTMDGGATAYSGATDGNGNAIAVWSDAITNVVEGSYFTAGAWGAPVTISTTAAIPTTLAVAMDATGTAVAVWIEVGGTVKASTFSAGSWSAPVTLDTLTLPNFGAIPSVSMNGLGQALAIWADAGGTNEARVSFFNGSSWSAPTALGIADLFTDTVVAYSANGTAVAGWIQGGTVTVDNFDGTVWSAPVSLGSSFILVQVGIDSSGKALAAWVDPSGIVFAESFDGVAWSGVPVTVSTGLSNTGISLAMAPGGTAVLVWIDGSSNGQGSAYDGSTWSAPMQFDSNLTAQSGPFQPATVSVDNAGNALVVYGTATPEVLSVQLPLGSSSFTSPLIIDPAPSEGQVLYTVSALSSNGFGFAFWSPFSEAPDAFASNLIPPPPLPPAAISGEACRNRFATGSERVHIIRWQPSTDPTVTAYNLRRNGKLIAIIPPTGPFVYKDHARCKRDTYTLTSVSIVGESSPLEIVIK